MPFFSTASRVSNFSTCVDMHSNENTTLPYSLQYIGSSIPASEKTEARVQTKRKTLQFDVK